MRPIERDFIGGLIATGRDERERRKQILSDLPFTLGRSKIVRTERQPNDTEWTCYPMDLCLDKSPDSLVCCIESQHSGWWENWNLEHTLQGIVSGFYRVETP